MDSSRVGLMVGRSDESLADRLVVRRDYQTAENLELHSVDYSVDKMAVEMELHWVDH